MRFNILPEEFRVLPEVIDLSIPEFKKFKTPYDKTFALNKIDCEQWFSLFIERIVEGINSKKYLPICRLSDGEFLFILGDKPPFSQNIFIKYFGYLKYFIKKAFFNDLNFEAKTGNLYHSGKYTQAERLLEIQSYTQKLKLISEKGILAIHLSYFEKPFQERFFPALKDWMRKSNIKLTDGNYFPFYFVYPAFLGSKKQEILKNRKVLIVHSAEDDKRNQIDSTLINEGVIEIFWLKISSSRSMYDIIDVSPYLGKIDLAFVGAGIGKPNILIQLEPLSVPCIDVGYVFEVWADSSKRFDRAGCATDLDWINKEK